MIFKDGNQLTNTFTKKVGSIAILQKTLKTLNNIGKSSLPLNIMTMYKNYNGYIDDFRVYDRALRQYEILKIYCSNLCKTCFGPIAN